MRHLATYLAVAISVTSCSAIVEFDDIEGLGCDCLPEYVCLVASNTCVRRRSVENFKSCSPDAVDPDALCPQGSICVNERNQGHRCLPTCTITNYATGEAGIQVANECRTAGTLCWSSLDRSGVGVCDFGECDALRQDCPAVGDRCVGINGGGRCFTSCRIFQTDACIGDPVCHPLLDSSETACIEPGAVERAELCSHTRACKKFDTSTGANRPMICARPDGSGDGLRCWPTCKFGNVGSGCGTLEACVFSRANIDRVTGENLGICTTN